MSEPVTCVGCGGELPAGDRYCPHCGTRVAGSSPSAGQNVVAALLGLAAVAAILPALGFVVAASCAGSSYGPASEDRFGLLAWGLGLLLLAFVLCWGAVVVLRRRGGGAPGGADER